MKKKSLLLLILPVITVILELLPWGVVLNFANPEGEPYRRTYSYFSLTPYGYANFSPFITALLSCVILILTFIFIAKPRSVLYKVISLISIIAFIISLAPLLYGIRNFTVIGAFISVLLLLHCCLIFIIRKVLEDKNEESK